MESRDAFGRTVDDEEGLSNKEELLVEIKQLQQEQVNLRREQEEAKFVLLARLDTLEKLLHK